ncbi:MAG: zinc finger Ran-binding domain-containing protein, partial [Anaerolineales bacterium]|nr:zinc finger Ran-binding domain-containing protein [Anaerolineales bacterium]
MLKMDIISPLSPERVSIEHPSSDIFKMAAANTAATNQNGMEMNYPDGNPFHHMVTGVTSTAEKTEMVMVGAEHHGRPPPAVGEEREEEEPWTCPMCTFENHGDLLRCEMCDAFPHTSEGP